MNLLMHQHGGDLDQIERTYKIPKEKILDFSGNINPLGFPESVKNDLSKNLDIICTYPDKRYIALKQSISKYTGANPEYIAVGNGSTELISTFIKTVNAKKVLILAPSYSEYEREVSIIKSKVIYFPLKEKENFIINIDELIEKLTDDIGLFIACNPNNPTGTAITSKQMEEILIHCKKIIFMLW